MHRPKHLYTTDGNMKSAELNELNYQFKTNINMKTKTSILTITKAFFTLLVMCCFLSCEDGQTGESIKVDSDHKTDYTTYGATVRVIVIDSCEYLYSYNFNATWCTHKGNCKFCAERAKRSLK